MPAIALLLALCASPLPDESAIKAAQRTVLETYRDDLGSEEGLRRVLSAADGLTGADQVAAYLVVAKSAAQSGLLRIGFEAIDRLARRFEYDAPAAKVSMLEGSVKRARTVEDRVSIVNRCLEILEQSVSDERLDVGDDALKIASSVVAKIRDPELRKELAAKRKSFEAAKKEFEADGKALDAARAALKRDERDPKANETMGRHLAARGDWPAAVLRLGRSDDEGLRRAAQADQAASRDTSKALGAADSWWAASEERAFRARAVYWYTLAVPSLSGLAKARAEKRIEEAKVDLSGQTVGDDKRMTILLPGNVPLVVVKIPASDKLAAFWIGETEVSQKQWMAVMGDNPASHKGDDLPIKNVDASQCLEFCRKISDTMPRFNVRLPTDAEWSHAFGSPEQYSRDYAGTTWCEINSGNKAHPVGKLKPNAFGLFDMLGNVRERVDDGSVALGIDFGTPKGSGTFDRQRVGAKSYLDNTGLRVAAVLK